jgi:hypothetical protein
MVMKELLLEWNKAPKSAVRSQGYENEGSAVLAFHISESETCRVYRTAPSPLRPFKVPALCKNSSMQEEGKKAIDSFDTIEGWPLPTVETEANGDF